MSKKEKAIQNALALTVAAINSNFFSPYPQSPKPETDVCAFLDAVYKKCLELEP